ncbi:MAG: hypothetical protein E6F98_06015 [Actinobacteria bacterium]|nr:MAG: hypothetical protein E6F98_06015 [Actinomycetota bacterium]
MHLPRAIYGDRKEGRRLLPRGSRRPSEGHRQEDPLADGLAEGEVPRGLRVKRADPSRREPALVGHRAGPGLLLQQVPRRLLRAHRLPHRLAAREPSARVHGRAHLLRDEHEGQGAVLRRRPDVNESAVDFAVVGGKIRFGLNAVKNVGETACRAIVAARADGGPFASIWDFTERVDPQVVNKRALESLVKAGALPGSRKAMLEILDQALGSGNAAHDARRFGQGSIFDLGDEPQQVHYPTLSTEEYDKSELLHMEKESLGLYVSEHPLSAAKEQLRRKTDCGIAELERRRDGEIVVVGGLVATLKQLTTKKGEPMVFATLEDLTGSVEVVAFNSVYATARDLLVQDGVLVVKGRVDHKQMGETKLVALEISAFEATPERKEVRLKVDARIAPAGVVRELAAVVKDFPGEAPVYVDLVTSNGPKVLELGPSYRVKPVPDFFAEVKALLGEAAVL